LQKAHANNVSSDGTNIKERTLPITTRFEIDLKFSVIGSTDLRGDTALTLEL